jgi:hypothetical protein
MNPENLAAGAAAVTTIVGSFSVAVRWMVKHYLAELKPNSGSSLRDQVTRLEARVDTIISILEK